MTRPTLPGPGFTEFVTRGGAHEHRYKNGGLLRWCPASSCTLEEFKLKCEGRATQSPATEPSDSEMLDWLEKQTLASRTGISFDHCRHVEEGHVVEKGFRYMRYRHLGDRHESIRTAIKSAMKNTP